MKNSSSKIDLTENVKSPLRATNTKKMLAHRTTLNSCLLLGPCLFDSRIRKNIKSINEKYHRINERKRKNVSSSKKGFQN